MRHDDIDNATRNALLSKLNFSKEEVLKLLLSKYGNNLLVEEFFEDQEEWGEAILPEESIVYNEYYHYYEFPEDCEFSITYAVKFDKLIEHLDDFFEDAIEYEAFFISYVYKHHRRKNFYETARIRNKKGITKSTPNDYYTAAYKQL